MDLRMPRVLTACCRCRVAVAGATFQGLIRNPLADPYVLGTASGAALGAAIAVVIPVHFVIVEFGLLHGLAFAFALITAFVVVKLGGGGSGGLTRLLLTGYAVGSILAALLTMAMYMSGQNLREIFSYLLGGLGGSSWIRLAVAAPIVLVACGVILTRARVLDGLLLGDAAAGHLGIDVRRERGILLAMAAMTRGGGISGLIARRACRAPRRATVSGPARRVIRCPSGRATLLARWTSSPAGRRHPGRSRRRASRPGSPVPPVPVANGLRAVDRPDPVGVGRLGDPGAR